MMTLARLWLRIQIAMVRCATYHAEQLEQHLPARLEALAQRETQLLTRLTATARVRLVSIPRRPSLTHPTYRTPS